MALLQISEPGQSPDPHQRRVAVGIDLGTTNSLVAAVRSGVAECLPDFQGQLLLPSVVRYAGEGRVQVGAPALEQAAHDAANTVLSVKRLMGKRKADLSAGSPLPYELVDGAGMVEILTRDGAKSPVETSAHILATLRQRAEDSFDEELYGAVITVPAYFDDAQRQATKDAAQLAGLQVLRLINEPTAAAIAYGLEHGAQGLYAVYDLGGGTFDISILRLSGGVFEVIATGGNSALGGDDFDAAIVSWAQERLDLPHLSVQDRRSLLSSARQAKEALSLAQEATLTCRLDQGEKTAVLTRAAFEQLTQNLIAQTMQAVRRALRDADLQAQQIEGVVMVGGATRMPAVQAAVQEFFGKAPLTNINPDEVVALGAAIQANLLAGNNTHGELLLLDVIPLSLGLEIMGGLVERIIERNTTIPTAQAQDFTTYQDGQTAMALHVVQGERDLVTDCRSLARFELRGIPPMAAGAARVRVTFQVDADGLLSVQAREETSGVAAQIMVKPSYGLGDEEIARMLQESFATAEQDMQVRALREAQVDADRLILATRSALAQDADLLDDLERDRLEQLISKLEHAVTGQAPAQEVESATLALSAATEGFAAARMNRGIRKALAGRTLNDI